MFDAIVFPFKAGDMTYDTLTVLRGRRKLAFGEQRFDPRSDFGFGELGGDADAVHDGALVG